MSAVDHPLIERFIEALWLEKGLSAHTQAAYRSDLALLNGWLQARGVELQSVGREVLLDHLASTARIAGDGIAAQRRSR